MPACRFRLAVAVLALVMSAADSQRPDLTFTSDGLEGTWVVTRNTDVYWQFSNGKLLILQRGKQVNEGVYRVDHSQTPATIDFDLTSGKFIGIFRVDGDEMLLCDTSAGANASRPKQFNGPGYTLTFKRLR